MIELIGWIATVFRSAGMLVKGAEAVKWLVSIGNLGWLISGHTDRQPPSDSEQRHLPCDNGCGYN